MVSSLCFDAFPPPLVGIVCFRWKSKTAKLRPSKSRSTARRIFSTTTSRRSPTTTSRSRSCGSRRSSLGAFLSFSFRPVVFCLQRRRRRQTFGSCFLFLSYDEYAFVFLSRRCNFFCLLLLPIFLCCLCHAVCGLLGERAILPGRGSVRQRCYMGHEPPLCAETCARDSHEACPPVSTPLPAAVAVLVVWGLGFMKSGSTYPSIVKGFLLSSWHSPAEAFTLFGSVFVHV